jgi:hypothetical protein
MLSSSPRKELRIGSSGISWKALEGGKTINVPASELKWAEWTRVARQFQLRVGLKDTWRKEAFDGFMRPVSKPSHTGGYEALILCVAIIGPGLSQWTAQATF